MSTANKIRLQQFLYLKVNIVNATVSCDCMQTADIEEIVRELERLRLQRKDFNESVDSQERELLQRLSNNPSYPPSLPDLISVPDQVPSRLRTPNISSDSYSSIDPDFILQPGHRVRITNSLRHISGPIPEEERLATVVKVNKIFIQVRTNTGHLFNRIKKNLQIADSTTNERLQGIRCEDGRSI